MLHQLELVNFQSHKQSALEFSPGVNIILGESDCGKSSIIRAINWGINNRPTGDSFRSTFSKSPTEVAMVFADGQFVRSKGSSFNGYNLESGDLKALRTDVPEEVKDIHKMDDVNIQSQAKAYFLLDETPGQVAKEFNAVAGLEEMDKCLQSVNSKIRTTNRSVTEHKEAIDQLSKDIDSLNWIDACGTTLLDIEEKNREVDSKKQHLENVCSHVASAKKIEDALSALPDLRALPKIQTIFAIDAEIEKKVEEYNRIGKIATTVYKLGKELKRYDVLVELRSFNTAQISQRRDEVQTTIETLESLFLSIDKLEGKIVVADAEILTLQEEERDLKSQIQYCETCGQLIKE